MSARPVLAMFGSSLVSAYWNGAATYYRGIVRALHDCGFDVVFYEPDAYERQQHRDIADPPWAQVVVYPATEAGVTGALERARDADIIVKASGVGVFDAWLEAEVAALGDTAITIFWDVDAPATLARMRADPDDALRAHVSRYDLVLTYGGGAPVIEEYSRYGARRCVPVYNALDPATHFAVAHDERFAGELGFLGNRLPDREARVREFFFAPAAALPRQRFVLGGSGWQDAIAANGNVHYVGHVYTRDHNAFNSSALAVLNINRDSMASTGFSPPTRIFEAAGAQACLICDAWEGIEEFLEPGSEVLCARSGAEVAELLAQLTPRGARQIGSAAQRRILAEHTYAHRARQLRELLLGSPLRAPVFQTGSEIARNAALP
jgi:spore maturation protein CgeB